MKLRDEFWFDGIILTILVSTINCLPATLVKDDNSLSRKIRETDSLKLELQKLRKILQDVRNDKVKLQTTTPTTSSVDKDFNQIIHELKTGDNAGIQLLSDAFERLKAEHKEDTENKEEPTYIQDGVGDFLGAVNHQTSQTLSDKILDILRILYNKERNKSIQNARTQQKTQAPETTTTTRSIVPNTEDDEIRQDILHAIERRLLRNVRMVRNYGISAQEIIADLQKQVSKKLSSRSVNDNLNSELKREKLLNKRMM